MKFEFLLRNILGLFLLIPFTGFGQQEVYFTDSTSFFNFIQEQNSISGLEFGLAVDGELAGRTELDSLFTLADTSLVSMTFSEFNDALVLKNQLENEAVSSEIVFYILGERQAYDVAYAYTLDLLTNDQLFPVGSSGPGTDLISLANRSPYIPSFATGLEYFSDIKVFAITVIIGLFLVIASSMILFMLIFKARRNIREKVNAQYEEEIVGPLSELLFEKSLEEIEQLSDEEVHGYFAAAKLKKQAFKEVLMDQILGLNKKMKGDFKLKLKALYKSLGLDQISIQHIKSKKWDKVVKGMVEVNEMDLDEALSEIKAHANSSNFYVRSQAVATLLNLSQKSDLSFLSEQNFPLSRWQQMNYLRIIKYLQSKRELNLESLFYSNNKSIRLFGYKLVRMIGRVDLLERLEQRFLEVGEEEKIEIIRTYEVLGAPLASELINPCLLAEDPLLSENASRAVGTIGNAESIEVLLGILSGKPSFKHKMILLKSLKELDPAKYCEFIEQSKSADVAQIDRHLTDPLLQDV
ncbi:hypothetical protein PBT90_10020 [Algoriphagus halophytocola]|uniref:DED domain-containing protein n=1 Tax=Algoriphagus halophytocola TaxID=2991499 RepID=A0ABY6MND8_9BACT|nr:MULTISPECIES: hypothetical protein [unclassified Algoriphagus]UZD23724.1 hypothetical protein OM944_04350 [Algoriphagus sp. TR-M5]WBL45018.1 hypothetical protein PBT90_10020 [Algoriphagus sp. TR-M9]